jgi:predicted P-loop ATPase
MDSILVLEGEQGEGKSRTVRALGQQWSADLSGNLADKDAAISLQRVWIAELAELTALRRSEQEPIKGFLTRTQDYYRPPYGRNNVMRPRHTVFIATTNERDYLLDPTGARRYWPVDCGSIDLKALEADVTQLWGEAMSRYGDREPWHLDKIQSARAVEEQAARQRTTPADQLVLEYADRLKAAGETKIEMRLLLQEAFDCDPKEDPMKASGLASNAARALVREGWKRLKPTGRGASRKQVYEWVTNIVTPDASQGSQGSQGISGENDDDIPF